MKPHNTQLHMPRTMPVIRSTAALLRYGPRKLSGTCSCGTTQSEPPASQEKQA